MYGWRARLGFIYPGPGKRDDDFVRMAPAGVSVHFSRVFYTGQDTVSNISDLGHLGHLVEAARLLAAAEPSCISWVDTSGSFVFGIEGDRAQVDAIRRATGIPATTTSSATLAAFRALGVDTVAVASPYIAEVNDQLVAFMEPNGVHVARLRSLEIQAAREVSRTSLETVYALGRAAYAPDAQALFIPCTDFAPLAVIEPLERDLGIPVVLANHATMWHALRLSGIRDRVEGFGQLLTCDIDRAGKPSGEADLSRRKACLIPRRQTGPARVRPGSATAPPPATRTCRSGSSLPGIA